jgi:hypothetical protein
VLVLDYLNAGFVREHLVAEDETRKGGIRVLSRRTLEGDRLVKRMTLTHLETGRIRQAEESLRLYDPAELRALAGECGLQPRGEAGDYLGSPFEPQTSSRWIGFLGRA